MCSSVFPPGAPGVTGWRTARRWLHPTASQSKFRRYLRRHTLRGALGVEDAEAALRAYHVLGLELYPTESLLDVAFAIRETVSFDDALYLTLARVRTSRWPQRTDGWRVPAAHWESTS